MEAARRQSDVMRSGGRSHTFDQLTAFDHVGVRVVNRYIETQGLQQDILIADQLLGLNRESGRKRCRKERVRVEDGEEEGGKTLGAEKK